MSGTCNNGPINLLKITNSIQYSILMFMSLWVLYTKVPYATIIFTQKYEIDTLWL